MDGVPGEAGSGVGSFFFFTLSFVGRVDRRSQRVRAKRGPMTGYAKEIGVGFVAKLAEGPPTPLASLATLPTRGRVKTFIPACRAASD